MKRTMLSGVIMVLTAIVALGAPSKQADLPAECSDIAPSLGPAPSALTGFCRQFVTTEGALPEVSTDTAFSPEVTTGQMQSMVLNTPQSLVEHGMVDFSNFIGACDFAGSDFTKLYCYDTTNAFFTLNTTTGVRTPVGAGTPFGGETVTGLAWDDTTRIMYAGSTDVATSSLYTVSLATGALSRIGAVSNSAALISLAANRMGQLYGHDIASDSLIMINKANAAGTVVGPLGFNANFGQGMDFDPTDGTCYLFAFNASSFQAELRTCNPVTGATTLVGVMGSSSHPGVLILWPAGSITTGVDSYRIETSVTDPRGCAAPLADADGEPDAYVNLEALGILANPSFSGDNVSFPVDFGVEFNFWGRPQGQVINFTDDGFAFFDPSTPGPTPGDHQPIPTLGDPDSLMAVFWRDLEIVYDAPSNRGVTLAVLLSDGVPEAGIIEYDDVEDWPAGSNPTYDFELVAYFEPDPDRYEYIFAYDNLTGPVSIGTIGLENQDGTLGAQYAFDSITVTDGMAVCFDFVADPLIFADGFESGDTAAWTRTVP